MASRAAFAAVITTVLFTCPGQPAADPLQEGIRALAGKLAALPELKGKRLGVGDFPSSHGTKLTQLGAFISDRLEVELSKLSRTYGFDVVERRNLGQLAKEWHLWTSDHVSPSEAQRLGNLAGLNVILLGTLTDLDKEIVVTIKPVEAATGRNLGAEDLTIQKYESINKLLNAFVPESDERGRTGGPPGAAGPSTAAGPTGMSASRLDVRLWTDKVEYRLGESLKLHFTTSRDAYVTLINLATNGAMSIIFPNKFSKSNFVKAGQVVTVPGEQDPFDFVLHGQPGREIIRAIATEEAVELGLGDLQAVGGPIQTFTTKEVSVVSRDIAKAKARTNPARWSEFVLPVDVR